MQANKRTYAQDTGAGEEAELSFKRFILEETAGFEQSPEADLFRVNTLAQMLDRFDDYIQNGCSAHAAIGYTKREFSDLRGRMRESGFEEADAETQGYSRWPLLSEEEAAQYLKESSAYQHRVAIGVALFCACCLPILLLCGMSELFLGYASDTFSLLGVGGMFGMIGMGVYSIVMAKKPKDREKIRHGRYSLGGRLRKKLSEFKQAIDEKSRRRMGKGIAMLVTCVVPIILGAALDSLLGLYASPFAITGVGGMFIMIGAGVYELIMADGEKKTIKKLLNEKKK